MPALGGTIYIGQGSKLDNLAKEAKTVIFEARSSFPFDLTPNKITICANRITVTVNKILSNEEYPLPTANITSARISESPMFASLIIETFGIQPPPALKYLKKVEAHKARRYILALIQCKKDAIDLSSFSLAELREKLQKIGKVQKG